ncbi:MAG: TrmH family RNA methyltransferase [Rhizobiaceae bacterium]
MSSSKAQRPGKVQQITAVSNPRIKSIRSLAMKKNRDETGTFFVEGMKLVRDAFENGWVIRTLVYASSFVGKNNDLEDFAARARATGSDILEVNEKVLNAITKKDNPQMIVGVMEQNWHQPTNIGALTDPKTVWLALDRIRDPGNLGTIIRTADCAGVNGIILIGDTTDPFSVEATRATMGSIFNVPLIRMTEDTFIKWRKSWPGLVAGTHLAGATDYRSIDFKSRPVLLLMGNEQQGLTDALASACDELVLIPMAGSADSLNLAIATGVMLFHMEKHMPDLVTRPVQ